jgi:hypothetical protein
MKNLISFCIGIIVIYSAFTFFFANTKADSAIDSKEVADEVAEFRTDFSTEAAKAAIEIAGDVALPPPADLNDPGSVSVLVAEQFADVNYQLSEEDTGILSLLERINNAIQIDIRQTIIDSQNRFDRYDEILQTYESLLEEARALQQALRSERQSLSDEIETTEERIGQLNNATVEAIENYNQPLTKDSFDELVELRKRLVELETGQRLTNRYESRLVEIGNPLKNRIRAMKANREALIEGVQVDPQTARTLDLFKDSSEEE